MVNYKCLRCGFETYHKTNFKKHLTRKFPCKPILEEIQISQIISNYNLNESPKKPKKGTKNQQFIHKKGYKIQQKCSKMNESICSFCDKKLSCYKSRKRHEKICKVKIKMEKEKDKDVIIKDLQDKLEDLIIEISKLKNESKHIYKYNSIDNSKYCSDNTIIVNNFGKENLEYLTDKHFQSFLTLPTNGIPKMIEYIHFNPNHPENHNIRIKNKKLKWAEVKEDNKWIIKHKKEVLDDLIDNGFITLEEYKDKNLDNLDDLLVDRYLKMSKFYNDNKDDLMSKTELVVLNGSKNIEI